MTVAEAVIIFGVYAILGIHVHDTFSRASTTRNRIVEEEAPRKFVIVHVMAIDEDRPSGRWAGKCTCGWAYNSAVRIEVAQVARVHLLEMTGRTSDANGMVP